MNQYKEEFETKYKKKWEYQNDELENDYREFKKS